MQRLMGIETEYGIMVEGLGANDWVSESIALVKCHPGAGVSGWNYRGEDARRDMRGFTVQNLSTNPDDAQFDRPSAPVMSREEERSDRVLANGARLYNDHGHPEYATPECLSLRDLVAQDKAGERIMLASARKRAEARGLAVSLTKNNTDFHGASYGTHENYLMSRSVPTDLLIQALLPFFATRALYAGAGKCGVENEAGRRNPNTFQLSQRADFLSVEASVDTLHNRPLVNTRDEPHAAPTRYRRLHVICGDANMSEHACALKVGTTSLVLRLLEAGLQPSIRLVNPVQSARTVSRDLTFKEPLERVGGPAVTAIEVQRTYLDEAVRRFQGEDEETDWVLAGWTSVLDELGSDYTTLSDRLDWAAKYQLLDGFRRDENLAWGDLAMQSLDLAYHDIDPDQSLYYGLEQAGQMRRFVTDARVGAAVSCPPADTRAALRGLFVQRYGAAVRRIGWNGIAFEFQGEDLLFDMNTLVEANLAEYVGEMVGAGDLEQVVAVIRRTRAADEAGEKLTGFGEDGPTALGEKE